MLVPGEHGRWGPRPVGLHVQSLKLLLDARASACSPARPGRSLGRAGDSEDPEDPCHLAMNKNILNCRVKAGRQGVYTAGPVCALCSAPNQAPR